MHRRLFLALSLFTLTLPAHAGEEEAHVLPLTAGQIETLLSGNTIVGTWSGTSYRQYFDANGSTIYRPEGGRADPGKWRVNTETDMYESWWEQTGWTPYRVVMTNDGYAWVSRDRLEPFEVVAGRQVDG